jgi:hypothetical protein
MGKFVVVASLAVRRDPNRILNDPIAVGPTVDSAGGAVFDAFARRARLRAASHNGIPRRARLLGAAHDLTPRRAALPAVGNDASAVARPSDEPLPTQRWLDCDCQESISGTLYRRGCLPTIRSCHPDTVLGWSGSSW